jgi:thiamine transport system ATP-binding protein
MRGASRIEQRQRVGELLELVGLPDAARRSVAALSGGEQQRVALARALAPRPRLLMLDEPLGQLDRSLRERLVVELRELFGRLGTTVLAVTHDQGEAFALADRVVVMRDGRIAQSGTPLEVWQRPADAFVARFLGFDNVVEATVAGQAADTPWGKVPVPEDAPQGTRTLLVRPAGVRLVPADAGLRCTVTARTFRGTHVAVHLRPGDAPRLEAACGLRSAPEVGDVVGVEFDAAEIAVLG